jgi:hypothetical protein
MQYRLFCSVVGIVFLSGCATVVNGTRQKIGVSSNPPGAGVLIDNQAQIFTPATVELTRDQSHIFYFHKDGYQDDSFTITSGTSGWVLGNILLGGLVGGMVDFASGGARKLSQDAVHVTLAPLAAGQPAAIAAPTVAPAVYTPPPLPPSPIIQPVQAQPAYAPMQPMQPSGGDNIFSRAEMQLRNAEREFRAGRMSLEEFRQIKKVLQGER